MIYSLHFKKTLSFISRRGGGGGQGQEEEEEEERRRKKEGEEKKEKTKDFQKCCQENQGERLGSYQK